MRIHELFESDDLRLRVDNPGGSWIKEKREINLESGHYPNGAPMRLGPVTGSWNRQVLLPVRVVARFKGMRDEQNKVRHDSISYLEKVMKETGKLPVLDNGQQYAPFICVDQDGTPWVNEGNHRIMTAEKLGWKYIPIELRYFTGGEAQKGPLTPSDVKVYDAQARAANYKTGNDFVGVPHEGT